MAQVSFRIDEATKQEAEMILDEMGMSVSTAITIFLKTVCRERRIPFEITADPFYSAGNIRHLEKIAKRIEDGTAKLSEHELVEVDE